MFAGDVDGPAEVVAARSDDGVGDLADVLGGDAGKLGAAEREGQGECAVVTALGSEAEVDEVLPVESSTDDILMMAAGTGVSVLFSSADYGDEYVNLGISIPNYPASSPWATSVGGQRSGAQVLAADAGGA